MVDPNREVMDFVFVVLNRPVSKNVASKDEEGIHQVNLNNNHREMSSIQE